MSGNPETERWVHLFGGTLGILGNIVAILVGVFLLYAGLKIRKLENYNAGLIGSIIAMVPCISPCCLIGLPVGIWALVILNRPEVKSHFQ